MAFAPQFLDELRARLSLAAVVGRRVRLQRRGRELVGLCPFHAEKTPSFTVSEDKGFYHCFGCGAHGDVVGFVMNSEGLSFPEAVEKLAGEAGLPVPRDTPAERRRAERQQSLHAVLEAAAAWYAEQLRAPAGRAGLDYLRGRGLDEAIIARFRLGYAPESRTALAAALGRAGFAEEALVEAGLLIRPEDGGAPRDRFRGRIMFPITDRGGRVVAFGGRVVGQGEPKYLNSPETPLFHKGRMLYGLAQARAAAQERGEIVVVEGYMDVIALAQAGLPQAVAPLGTALTEEQIGLLWRLAPEPILCFDGDAAGQRAAARALERALPLLRPGLSLRFALLPAGEDPDSLARGAGPAALREILDRAQPMVAMLWQLHAAARPADTPERRAAFRRDIRERIRAIADRTVYEDYRAEIERRLAEAYPLPGRGSRPGGRAPWPGRSGRPGAASGYGPAAVDPGGQAARRGIHGLRREQLEILMATLLNHPALIAEHAEEVAHLPLPLGPLVRLRDAMIRLDAEGLALDSASLRGQLSSHGLDSVADGVLSRTRRMSFTRADAGLDRARAGFAHILAVLREGDARRERDLAAAALGLDPTDANLDRFNAACRLTLEGETQRRDLDDPGPGMERPDEARPPGRVEPAA